MAQAENTLLARMSNDRLPVPGTGGGEPREPTEQEEREIVQGRRPEDVVQARERPQPRTDDGDDAKTVAPKKWKIGDEELTLDQIAARGLLDRLIQSAQQLPHLSKKHQELLEKVADNNLTAKPAAPAPAAPAKIVPSPEQIVQTYLPIARQSAAEGHIETDFVEAYPQHASELMYFRDIVEADHERLEHVVNWIRAEVEMRNKRQIRGAMDVAIDRVAGRLDKDGQPDPLVHRLKDADVRKGFETWLMTELDPKVGSLTDENMLNFWLAFNAPELLKFTKEAADKPRVTPRPRAAGDGSSSRPGRPETPTEPTLLDRMSDMRLGSEA